MGIELKSSAFKDGGMIPSQFTCDGDDISPRLSWDRIPDRAQSIALIMDDPDAPRGTWVHWVIYNIPPDSLSLHEDIPADEELSGGAFHGINSWGNTGYGGPCPPNGIHRYFFKIYALDEKVLTSPGATKQQLEDAMKGHILDEGQLMGMYERT